MHLLCLSRAEQFPHRFVVCDFIGCFCQFGLSFSLGVGTLLFSFCVFVSLLRLSWSLIFVWSLFQTSSSSLVYGISVC